MCYQKCGLFDDLRKAFESVIVKLLLRKLEACGVRGPALALFASYLLDRKSSTAHSRGYNGHICG